MSKKLSHHGMARRGVAAAISAILAESLALHSGVARAQEEESITEVVVTATRREASVQDIPFNLTALTGAALQEQGASTLAEIGRRLPGLFVVDQGQRGANRIIVRGLNASSIEAAESLANGGGGTVATYVGEIPLYVDLKPVDLERIEVLLGPQGTLYGAGTMGGAIRYIPQRPALDGTSLSVRADTFRLDESDGLGARGGFTVNLPLAETLAFRSSVEYLDDPGVVDYPFLVREPGVSDPQPDFANPADVAANLRRAEDVDWQRTLYGRAALRWRPSERLDATLTYHHQDQEVGGRTWNHSVAFGTGRYEAAGRYLEPNDRLNQLAALEVIADLGFAELTSATGVSHFEEIGQRDQTDLLITLQYSYEAFPTFSAFTRDLIEEDSLTQELRLVSAHDGRLGWIAGLFYNRFEADTLNEEFTPRYSEYLVDHYGGVLRPDGLEYISSLKGDLTEMAIYGELTYALTDRWRVTAGARWYDYELDTRLAVDLPLILTFLGERGPDEVLLEYQPGGQKKNGTLFKFNTSFDFTPEVMGYLTVSEGYRIGNSNGLELCEDPPAPNQNVCATPGEYEYFPDTTTNYELGLRSQWLDRRITLNGSLFYVDWKDPQIAGRSLVGAQPITLNGEGAESRGVELAVDARLTDRFAVSGSFTYVQAELTEDAPGLLDRYVPPGFSREPVDGRAGDRLPGSPETQGALYLSYGRTLANDWQLDLNYGFTAFGDVLTRTGGRAGGETLPGFAVHQAWATVRHGLWSASLYADNLFNKYAVTGVRSTRDTAQTVADENGEPVAVRYYGQNLLRPREIGLRISYDFAL